MWRRARCRVLGSKPGIWWKWPPWSAGDGRRSWAAEDFLPEAVGGVGYRYAVLGGGRQGCAAAYDIGRFGDADVVLIGDIDRAAAERAAERVNGLAGKPVARGVALDVTDHAGLVQNPGPPWDYALTFNIAGLTNEYRGRAIFLRDGKLVEVPTFSEYEEVEFPPLGTLEAFTTAGGTSTAPRVGTPPSWP